MLAGVAAPAPAHPLAPALLELVEQRAAPADAPGRFAVRWRAEATAAATPRLPRRCREVSAGRVRADLALGFVERSWEVDCGARGLSGATLAVDGLAADRSTALVRVQWRDGVTLHGLLRGDAPAWRVPMRPDRGAVVVDHLRLGIAHLAAGPDHWLFVLGLLALVRGRRSILLAISAFTAGHAATLSLATLGFVHVPSRLVEVAIAATLVALAWELAERAAPTRAEAPAPRRPPLWARRPAWLAFAFGLIHGLGFAGALAELGLPDGEIPLALFGFNLGIEAGQLLLLAAWLLLVALAARIAVPAHWAPVLRAARRAPAYALGAIGVYWGLDRLF